MATEANHFVSPQPIIAGVGKYVQKDRVGPAVGGITMREFYAGLALQGLCAASAGYFNRVSLASKAVAVADELIDQLNKTPAKEVPVCETK